LLQQFSQAILSALGDCPTNFVMYCFLDFSKSPPRTKDEKRTDAKKNYEIQIEKQKLMWALAQVLPDILNVFCLSAKY
jgi:hypothetical protein